MGKLALLRAEFGGDQSEQTPGLSTNKIGERLSKAEFQQGELKLARQNLAQLTDQAWACLALH